MAAGRQPVTAHLSLYGWHDDTDDNCSMYLAVSQVQWSLKWAKMKMKPSKCRSVSISKGKLVEETFDIDVEVIPSIVEKPVKSLGRWYNSTLSDWEQVLELREFIVRVFSTINKTFLPGKLKLWCLQVGLLPRVRWPLTVYDVAISEVEKFERVMNQVVRNWLRVPHCLSTITLYGKGILE